MRQFSKGKLKEKVSKKDTDFIKNEITTLMETLQREIDTIKKKGRDILVASCNCDVKIAALMSFKKKICSLDASFTNIVNI